MGYQIADLNLFLRDIAAMDGVRNVYVLRHQTLVPARPRVDVFVEVEGGLTKDGFLRREAVYEAFEEEISEYEVREHLDLDYRVTPVGPDLSSPHIPADAMPIKPREEASSSM